MGKRMYRFLIILVSVIVIFTSLVLSYFLIDIVKNGLDEELTFFSLILKMLPTTLGILAIILVIIYIFSDKIISSILRPLYIASEKIGRISEEDEFDTSEEIYPFIKTIKEQRQEIEKVNLKYKESEKYRRDFAANVSHELKTPLTSINGYAEMIAAGITKQEDTQKFAKIIHREGIRLLGLIDSIISLSKLEGDNYPEVFFEDIDLYDITNNVISRLENLAKASKVNINLYGESVIIKGNKRKMEDLLTNLIDNAVKYNRQHGWIDIWVNKTDTTAIIKVKDSGIGIPAEDQERIFERFYRVDKSRSKRIDGSGIGLSIVKHIVEIHKGKVLLVSELHKGTEFQIILPR